MSTRAGPAPGRSRSAGIVIVLLASGIACVEAAARDAETDPVGVWSCLMYAPSGDQRFYLGLAADGNVHMARRSEAEEGVWRQLGAFRRSRERLEFDDLQNGRYFTASLGREELGGTWLGLVDRGGWWCAAAPFDQDDEPPPVDGLMETPVPAIMASPDYPRQAIREAKEGRTVSCFIVTGSGEILRPEVVESTDDVFREPTLEAVAASRYRRWGDDHAVLPACRSFTFELYASGLFADG